MVYEVARNTADPLADQTVSLEVWKGMQRICVWRPEKVYVIGVLRLGIRLIEWRPVSRSGAGKRQSHLEM